VNDFVEPKIDEVGADISKLRQNTNRSKKQEQELAALTDLEHELRDFREELLRIARVLETEPQRRRPNHRRPAVETLPAQTLAEDPEGDMAVAGKRRLRLGPPGLQHLARPRPREVHQRQIPRHRARPGRRVRGTAREQKEGQG
jgi:hypothetical protein